MPHDYTSQSHCEKETKNYILCTSCHCRCVCCSQDLSLQQLLAYATCNQEMLLHRVRENAPFGSQWRRRCMKTWFRWWNWCNVLELYIFSLCSGCFLYMWDCRGIYICQSHCCSDEQCQPTEASRTRSNRTPNNAFHASSTQFSSINQETGTLVRQYAHAYNTNAGNLHRNNLYFFCVCRVTMSDSERYTKIKRTLYDRILFGRCRPGTWMDAKVMLNWMHAKCMKDNNNKNNEKMFCGGGVMYDRDRGKRTEWKIKNEGRQKIMWKRRNRELNNSVAFIWPSQNIPVVRGARRTPSSVVQWDINFHFVNEQREQKCRMWRCTFCDRRCRLFVCMWDSLNDPTFSSQFEKNMGKRINPYLHSNMQSRRRTTLGTLGETSVAAWRECSLAVGIPR